MSRLTSFLPRSKRLKLEKWAGDIPARLRSMVCLKNGLLLVLLVASFALGVRVGLQYHPAVETQEEPLPVALSALPEAGPEEQVQEDPRKADAEILAKVLYGMRGNSDADLTCVCWVVVNRVESPLFPNTVDGVCNQPQQWVGYYDSNPITDRFYGLALGVLTQWDNDGHRPFDRDFLYFDWSSSDIVFRTKFEGGNACKYFDN